LLLLLPMPAMDVRHTTTIRASMTAYSTPVGPSSFRRKESAHRVSRCMSVSLPGGGVRVGGRRGRGGIASPYGGMPEP
jgi:hypothetical protein